MPAHSSSKTFGHRDGFTVDSIMALNDVTLKNPIFNVALLGLALRKAGAPFTDWRTLLGWVTRKENRTWGITLSGLLIGASLLRRFSDHLSRLARNNGTITTGKWDWSKEIVLVTGASSGIGQRVCQMLIDRGVTVVGWDVQPLLYNKPAKMHFYTVDITNPESVEAAAAKVKSEVGHPTVLVNNAGVGTGQIILRESRKSVERTMNVNALSHYWMAQAFVPEMVKHNHGHVVTIASMASYASPIGISAYGMSKAAAKAFHYTLMKELKWIHNVHHVRTSMINPLWTATPLLEPHSVSAASGKNQKGLKVMHVDTVAERIVDVILSGESQHLCLPRSITVGSLLRGFPDWLHLGALDRTAQDMEKFESSDLQKEFLGAARTARSGAV